MTHVPSYRAPDLPPGYADFVTCGRRITKEDWVADSCPGRPTDPTPERRAA